MFPWLRCVGELGTRRATNSSAINPHIFVERELTWREATEIDFRGRERRELFSRGYMYFFIFPFLLHEGGDNNTFQGEREKFSSGYMYVCMYIRMYVCMYVCMHVYVYVYL